jgi:hypothetical protein
VALAARVERYDDEDQVNIATGLDRPFIGNGASIGVDVAPIPRLLWRTELRGFAADGRIFPDAGDDATLSKRNVFAVTSLALTF